MSASHKVLSEQPLDYIGRGSLRKLFEEGGGGKAIVTYRSDNESIN